MKDAADRSPAPELGISGPTAEATPAAEALIQARSAHPTALMTPSVADDVGERPAALEVVV